MINANSDPFETCAVIPIHYISLSTLLNLIEGAKGDANRDALIEMGVDLTNKILITRAHTNVSGEVLLELGYGPKSLARDTVVW